MVTEQKSKERKNRVTLRAYAKTMRHGPTETEKKFWWMVRDRRLGGYEFKRQYPIGNYITDFVCLEAMLIVELDGGQHAEQQEYDAMRNAFFAARGFRVIRFWNPEFLKNQDAVARQLLAELDGGKPPHPNPLPHFVGARERTRHKPRSVLPTQDCYRSS